MAHRRAVPSSKKKSAAPSSAPPAETPAPSVQWYHPDPDESYTELRSGTTPGVLKAILIGLGISIAGVGLMYGAAWINGGPERVTPPPANASAGDDHWAPSTRPATRPAPHVAAPMDSIRVRIASPVATTQASAD